MKHVLEKGLNDALECSINGHLDMSEKILRGLDQTDCRVQFNLGWHDLRHGNFRKGCEGLDKGRWVGVFGAPSLNGSMWNGQGLENRVVLLRGEGGLGDQIINARFVKILEDRGAKVIYSCDESLWAFFARNGIQCCSTVTAEKKAIYYDYWAPAMSVAYMLGYDYDTLPGSPYLFSARCLPETDRLRIGIRWGGNVENDIERYRSISPTYFEYLTDYIDADFYSFQRDANIVEGSWKELSPLLKDWADTARWLKSMDVLITSCTSVAHMAAAIGVETWIIIPLLSYYTWAVPGSKSAWHDKVVLFRQTEIDVWESPIAEIVARFNQLEAKAA